MIAKLKSAAAIDLKKGDNEIFVLADDTNGAKITEIIASNKSSAQIKVSIRIYKASLNDIVTIIPPMTFIANEGKVIPLATILEPGDKVLAETNAANSVDVLISVIEL